MVKHLLLPEPLPPCHRFCNRDTPEPASHLPGRQRSSFTLLGTGPESEAVIRWPPRRPGPRYGRPASGKEREAVERWLRPGGGRRPPPPPGEEGGVCRCCLPPPRGLGAGRLLAAPPVPSASRPGRRRRCPAGAAGGGPAPPGTAPSPASSSGVPPAKGRRRGDRRALTGTWGTGLARSGARCRPLPRLTWPRLGSVVSRRGGGRGTVPAAPLDVATPAGEGRRRSGVCSLRRRERGAEGCPDVPVVRWPQGALAGDRGRRAAGSGSCESSPLRRESSGSSRGGVLSPGV